MLNKNGRHHIVKNENNFFLKNYHIIFIYKI